MLGQLSATVAFASRLGIWRAIRRGGSGIYGRFACGLIRTHLLEGELQLPWVDALAAAAVNLLEKLPDSIALLLTLAQKRRDQIANDGERFVFVATVEHTTELAKQLVNLMLV